MNIKFGTGVAIITPFKKDLSIDYDALSLLIDHVIDGGVEFIVSMGTTGESAVLSSDEKISLVSFTKTAINKRVPLVLGIGGNNTQNVIDQINNTDFHGVDAILSASPSYIKPSQEGIYQHFKAISEASPVDIILYNVPGRTASNMSSKTTLRLANDFKNIVAIKEASGDVSQIMNILRDKPADFNLYSGDDDLALPLILMGAQGVISVLAMVQPYEFSEMVRQGISGNIKSAKISHYSQLELIKYLFIEGNPSGVKACLEIKGICEQHVRLPLVPVSKETYKKLEVLLK